MSAAPSPWRIEARATVALALPLVAANLLQMAVYSVDVIFVARLGPQALAASSLSVSILGLLLWASTGLVGAVSPLVAAELGRRRHAVREVRRSFRMALWLAGLASLAVLALCLGGEAFMRATGQDDGATSTAGPFLRLLMWSAPPAIVAAMLRSFVAAMGRAAVATLITALGLGVNIVGNYALGVRPFRTARVGPARVGDLQHRHHVRDDDRLCRGDFGGPAAAALPAVRALVAQRLDAVCRSRARRPAHFGDDHRRGRLVLGARHS